MLKSIAIAVGLAAGACGSHEGKQPAPAPSANVGKADLLDELRAEMPKTILDDRQDAANWDLAKRVVDEKLLVGKTRAEVEARLGAGGACEGSLGCAAGDWSYEVGKLRKGWEGGTPILVVEFGGSDTVTGARTIHTQ